MEMEIRACVDIKGPHFEHLCDLLVTFGKFGSFVCYK